MGEFIKDSIKANVLGSEPSIISLANNPNYITFSGKKYAPMMFGLRNEVNDTIWIWFGKNDHTDVYSISIIIENIKIQGVNDDQIVLTGTQNTSPNQEAGEFCIKENTTMNFLSTLEIINEKFLNGALSISGNNISLFGEGYCKFRFVGTAELVTILPEDGILGKKPEDPPIVIPPVKPEPKCDYTKLESEDGKRIDFWLTLKEQTQNEKDEHLPDHAITIVDRLTQTTHKITSTTDIAEVDSATYYEHEDLRITAENIKHCLLNIPFFKGNFDISCPIIREVESNNITQRPAIHIVAKEAGRNLKISVEYCNQYMTLEDMSSENIQTDLMSEGMIHPHDMQIEIEMYKDHKIPMGIADRTTLGVPATNLSKSYSNQSVWFDVNSIWRNQNKYSTDFLGANSWCDAGTVTDFRFVAKRRDGIICDTFYLSDPLYVVTGYNRALENNNLEDYVFDRKKMIANPTRKIKPLTTLSKMTHIKGQAQFFNFIMSKDAFPGYDMALEYQCFSSSASSPLPITITPANSRIGRDRLNVVNTIRLDLDTFLYEDQDQGQTQWTDTNIALSKKIDTIKVSLVMYEGNVKKTVSTALEFRIMPRWLFAVHDFAFLNSLGGWSSFNFSGKELYDFKASGEMFYKNQTPASTISSDIESVYSKQVNEQFQLETMPLQRPTADWLKQMASSVAVYEISTGRYVIVDDLSIKTNNRDDLFTLQMKYHYSDSYNGSTMA